MIVLIQATGKNFEGTVMMGQLPLSIAALTLNGAMVELLLSQVFPVFLFIIL
jgi:hypothetical protein